MRTLVTAMAVLTLLGGCATTTRKPVYEKAGAGAEQKKKDEVECTKASLDTGSSRAAAYLAVDREAVDRCMRERGYTLPAAK